MLEGAGGVKVCAWSASGVVCLVARLVAEVTRRDVGLNLNAFMKGNGAHAVAYNLETEQWQFASPVHRRVVVRWAWYLHLLFVHAMPCGSDAFVARVRLL